MCGRSGAWANSSILTRAPLRLATSTWYFSSCISSRVSSAWFYCRLSSTSSVKRWERMSVKSMLKSSKSLRCLHKASPQINSKLKSSVPSAWRILQWQTVWAGYPATLDTTSTVTASSSGCIDSRFVPYARRKSSLTRLEPRFDTPDSFSYNLHNSN